MYEQDIKLAELYNKLLGIEKNVHFLRTEVSASLMQLPEAPVLTELKNRLTDVLTWFGTLLFYLDDASEDLPNKSLKYYHRLVEMDNPPQRNPIMGLSRFAEEINKQRRALFHEFLAYEQWLIDEKPCMKCFEELDDAIYEAQRLVR